MWSSINSDSLKHTGRHTKERSIAWRPSTNSCKAFISLLAIRAVMFTYSPRCKNPPVCWRCSATFATLIRDIDARQDGARALASKEPVHCWQFEADLWHHPVPSSPQAPQLPPHLQHPLFDEALRRRRVRVVAELRRRRAGVVALRRRRAATVRRRRVGLEPLPTTSTSMQDPNNSSVHLHTHNHLSVIRPDGMLGKVTV